MPYIGIDFGTSNSVVANFQYGQADVLPNPEGQKWTPSVVTMRRDGSLSFGQEAKENFEEQRSIRSIKRILGTPERVPLVVDRLCEMGHFGQKTGAGWYRYPEGSRLAVPDPGGGPLLQSERVGIIADVATNRHLR